jgi:hypothetical protein
LRGSLSLEGVGLVIEAGQSGSTVFRSASRAESESLAVATGVAESEGLEA